MIEPIKRSEKNVPVSNKILGQFIESGFGRQVPGMWSEMIYNRAFRKIMPYSFYTWEWLGFEEPMYNENAPFWHDGYEEHDWIEIGDVSRKYTHGSNTFKGKQSLILENLKEGIGGLKQERIYVEEGKPYQFSFFAGVQGKHKLAGLDGFEGYDYTGDNRLFSVIFTDENSEIVLQKDFTIQPVQKTYETELVFPCTGYMDLQLCFSWKGTVLLSWVSMMPKDNLKGWRKDVVEQLKSVHVPLVRFPGGCFVSFYDWESSIGPRDRREPMDSYYWGGLEENDVGLDEFMDLSELVGFEPQVCFNMMSSYPFKARQMVEYLNAPKDVGMGRLRCLNGYPNPRHARFFEMDNEPWRKWTPNQYAQACVEFGTEMRKADESILLMMACYGYPIESLPDMLDIAGNVINFVIYRRGDAELVSQVLPILKEYNEKTGRHIRLVNTEWLPWTGSRTPFDDPSIPTDFDWGKERITNNYKHTFGYFQVTWNYALNGAERILDYMSYGGEFYSANFNNCCNTWGQNIINASRSKVWLSCAGEMFRLFGDYFLEGCPTDYDTGIDGLRMVSIQQNNEQRVFIVNNTKSQRDIQLNRNYKGETLCGSDRLNKITQEENPLKRENVSGSDVITVKPWSITALITE